MSTFAFHPPLTAFPLAFILLAALLQVLALIRGGGHDMTIKVLLLAATLSVIAAFFSGYQASDHADQTFKIPDSAISYHHLFGRLLLFIMPFCYALRLVSERAKHSIVFFQALYLISLAASVALVCYTGYLGGQLVFHYGAGVYAQ